MNTFGQLKIKERCGMAGRCLVRRGIPFAKGELVSRESVIEKRLYDDYTIDNALKENALILTLAKKHNVNYILMDDAYNVHIDG